VNEIDTEIVKLRLEKMLNGSGYFSICDLDRLGRMMGVNVQSHLSYKKLSTLHCINYSEMSPALKNEISSMVMECLTSRFETGLMAKAITAIRNGEVKDEPNIEDFSPNVYRISK